MNEYSLGYGEQDGERRLFISLPVDVADVVAKYLYFKGWNERNPIFKRIGGDIKRTIREENRRKNELVKIKARRI